MFSDNPNRPGTENIDAMVAVDISWVLDFCTPEWWSLGPASILIMWVKQYHKPSPSHHHQYIYICDICDICGMDKPFPAAGWFMTVLPTFVMMMYPLVN